MVADDAVEGREHVGVAEVDLGEFDLGLGVETCAAAGSDLLSYCCTVDWLGKSCRPSVNCLLYSCPVVFQRRLVGGERRIRLVQLLLIGVALDAEQ